MCRWACYDFIGMRESLERACAGFRRQGDGPNLARTLLILAHSVHTTAIWNTAPGCWTRPTTLNLICICARPFMPYAPGRRWPMVGRKTSPRPCMPSSIRLPCIHRLAICSTVSFTGFRIRWRRLGGCGNCARPGVSSRPRIGRWRRWCIASGPAF